MNSIIIFVVIFLFIIIEMKWSIFSNYFMRRLDIYDMYEQTQLSALSQPSSITIVTAYYNIPGKHDLSKYQSWFSHFSYLNPSCPLIVFSTGSSLEWIQTLLSKRKASTQIIDLPIEQFVLYPYFPQLQYQHQMDPERDIHSPELYLIWNEKPHFVQRAIQQSKFRTDYFCWMDCGIVRDARLSVLIKDFMNPYAFKYISTRIGDRLGMLMIEPSNFKKFKELDSNQISKVNHKSHRLDCIGGGLIIGKQESWYSFSRRHFELFKLYLQNERFVGKEQNIFVNLVVQTPMNYELFQPMQPKNFMNKFQMDPWMSMLNVCIAGDAITRAMHVPVFKGRLGNNLFEVAAVYNIAQSTRGLCVLNQTLENNIYVKSIFQRFPIANVNVTHMYRSENTHQFESEWFKPISKSCIEYHHYFQHYKYSEPFFNDFRELLVLPETRVEQCMFLHMRFGDYLNIENKANHFVDLTRYYQRCLEQINSNVWFKVFSDDLKQAEQFIQMHLKEALQGRYELVDMDEQRTLSQMINCSLGGICGNSTFSWWGARLNPHPHKQIFYPSQQYPETSKYKNMDITGLFHPSFTIVQV
jgi:hypothetical protein